MIRTPAFSLLIAMGLSSAPAAEWVGSAVPDLKTELPRALVFPLTRPAAPTTNPILEASGVPKSRAFSSAYAILLHRNLFARGFSGAPVQASAAQPAGPESLLAFRGVGLADGKYTAFIEDTASQKMQRYKPGDAIAAGQVVSVSLDRLEYASSGKIVGIALGQNLAGAPMPVARLAAPTTAPSPNGGPGQRPGMPPLQPSAPAQPAMPPVTPQPVAPAELTTGEGVAIEGQSTPDVSVPPQ